MPVSWMKHNDRLILYSDYRGLKSEDKMLENLKEDTFISKTFMNELTEVGKRQKGKTLKSAILGVTGFKKVFVNAYSRVTGEAVRAFDTEEAALNYLTS